MADPASIPEWQVIIIVLQGIHGIAYIHLIALCGIDGMLYYLRAGTIAQQAARIDRAGS